MSTKFKVYGLRNPLTDNIFYVGVTGQKLLSQRLKQHVYDARHYRGKNKDKDEIIRTLSEPGKRPTIELFVGSLADVAEADAAEKLTILEYGQRYELTNVKVGGFDWVPSVVM